MQKNTNKFQFEKYKSNNIKKGNNITRNDSTETDYSKNETKEFKFDFQIPDFFNDKPKIYYKFNYVYPLVPEWYVNINKQCLGLSNENFDDELLFT